eukprot:466972_1
MGQDCYGYHTIPTCTSHNDCLYCYNQSNPDQKAYCIYKIQDYCWNSDVIHCQSIIYNHNHTNSTQLYCPPVPPSRLYLLVVWFFGFSFMCGAFAFCGLILSEIYRFKCIIISTSTVLCIGIAVLTVAILFLPGSNLEMKSIICLCIGILVPMAVGVLHIWWKQVKHILSLSIRPVHKYWFIAIYVAYILVALLIMGMAIYQANSDHHIITLPTFVSVFILYADLFEVLHHVRSEEARKILSMKPINNESHMHQLEPRFVLRYWQLFVFIATVGTFAGLSFEYEELAPCFLSWATFFPTCINIWFFHQHLKHKDMQKFIYHCICLCLLLIGVGLIVFGSLSCSCDYEFEESCEGNHIVVIVVVGVFGFIDIYFKHNCL